MGGCVSVADERTELRAAQRRGKGARKGLSSSAGSLDGGESALEDSDLSGNLAFPAGPHPTGYNIKQPKGKAVPLPLPPSATSGPSPNNSSGSEGSNSDHSSSSGLSDTGSLKRGSSGSVKMDVRTFSAAEIQQATKFFRPNLLLGEGGFGKVYMGWIDEEAAGPPGRVVAVKRLNQGGYQGHKEWLTEVKLLSQLQHANLVQLVGFCLDTKYGERSLVYEYMPRGSLERHLFSREEGDESLSWEIRMKVAVEAAKGLAYLHEDREHQQIIYRDFKASNILLDEDYTVKLSDFGLARETEKPQGGTTHVTTAVMGTYGYTAPEYLMKGHLSARSDVYSYGVVLLEIMSGLQSVDKRRPSGQQNLVQWAQPFLADKRRLYKLIDPRLEGNYSIKAAKAAAEVAQRCILFDPRLRPTMGEVVELLSPLLEMKDPTAVSSPPSRSNSLLSSSSFKSVSP